LARVQPVPSPPVPCSPMLVPGPCLVPCPVSPMIVPNPCLVPPMPVLVPSLCPIRAQFPP
ncbi:unnamed protein product, partial [Sphagnum jensenii]